MSTFAQDTSVSVEKSRAEIETTLSRYGASRFGYMTDEHQAVIGFTFNKRFIKFVLPLPNACADEFTLHPTMYNGRPTGKVKTRPPEMAHKMWEQACRSRWRSLNLCIKAKLEACAAGITTFEKEFLAHFVMPGGQTLGDKIIPQLERMALTGKMPQLTLTSDNDWEDGSHG